MIEIVDGVLEFLEDVLLPLALMGHVGDGPERRLPTAGPRHGPHAHAVPAEFAAQPLSDGDRRISSVPVRCSRAAWASR